MAKTKWRTSSLLLDKLCESVTDVAVGQQICGISRVSFELLA
jgi:hypothetical protein